MKRAASTNDFSDRMQIQRHGAKSQPENEKQMIIKDEFEDVDVNASSWTEDDTIAEDSPFDRSYFRFEDEYAEDGRHHEAHVGGRALDAIVVSTLSIFLLYMRDLCLHTRLIARYNSSSLTN